jgi:hypothetical protein
MPLNLDAIDAVHRARFINIGKGWGSQDTLAQADRSLLGAGKRAALLAEHGFTADDASDLHDAKGMLEAAGVTREGVRAGKKSTSTGHVAALSKAKAARRAGRRVLDSTISASRAAALLVMTGTLAQTQRSGADPDLLATQLELLAAALTGTAVAGLVSARGGPAAATTCTSAARELRASLASVATPAGTPAETERLNLIDGIIVELCRQARAAAREAADKLGEEAIATELELTELNRAVSRRPAKPPEPVNA